MKCQHFKPFPTHTVKKKKKKWGAEILEHEYSMTKLEGF